MGTEHPGLLIDGADDTLATGAMHSLVIVAIVFVEVDVVPLAGGVFLYFFGPRRDLHQRGTGFERKQSSHFS